MKARYIFYLKKLTLLSLLIIHFSGYAQFQKGKASYYADKFEGGTTANGEIYDGGKLTAAHPTLPFGTLVKVTNLENNKHTVVRINDRGPFEAGRIIDLSKSAAEAVGLLRNGVALVSLKVIHPDTIYPPASSTFYEVEVRGVIPTGFGVQIVSFGQQDNLISFSEQLRKHYNTRVIIQTRLKNDQKSYAVIVGKFKNRKEAINFKNILSIQYADSYIVDFSKF